MFKKIAVFGLVLTALIACDTTTDPDPGGGNNGSNNAQLQATFIGWNRGVREVRAIRNSTTASDILARGQISTQGVFGLQLPDTVANLGTFNPPSGCNASPTDAKIAILTAFDVYNTDTDKRTGQLVQTNNGSKFVFRFYVDRDVNATGACVAGSSQQTMALNLKRGWNAVTVASTGINQFRISTDPVSSDLSWQFIPASENTIQLIAPAPAIELGNTMKLQADVRDLDGEPVANAQLSWTSSNSEVISVDTSGVVTAKALGNADVYVNLIGAGATGSVVKLQVYGFDARGGTFNTNGTTLGTAVEMRYVDANGKEPTQPFDFTITGPTGWNNNQPYVGTFQPRNPLAVMYSNHFVTIDAPVVAGAYNIRPNGPVITTNRANDLITVIPTRAIQYPQGMITQRRMQSQESSTGSKFSIVDVNEKAPTVTNARLSSLSQNAAGVDAGVTFENQYNSFIEAFNITDNKPISKRISYGWQGDALTGLSIEKNKSYRIDIYNAMPKPMYDITMKNLFNASRVSVLIDFRPQVQSLSVRGGSTVGGYALLIKGLGLTTDTTVRFGSAIIPTANLLDASTLKINVPNGLPGEVDVTVTNINGTSSVSASSKFKYYEGREFAEISPITLLQGFNGDMYYVSYESPDVLNRVKLTKISDSGNLTSIDLAGQTSLPKDMTLDASGNVWILFSQAIVKVILSGAVETLMIPNDINAAIIAIDSNARIWIGHESKDKISYFNQLSTELITFDLPVPSFCAIGFTSNNDMVFDKYGDLWFTSGCSVFGRIKKGGSIEILSQYSSFNNKLSMIDDEIWGVGFQYGKLTKVKSDGTMIELGSGCGQPRVAKSIDGYLWCPRGGYSLDLLRRSDDGSTQEEIAVSGSNYISSITDFQVSSTGKLWYIGNNGKVGYIQP